MESRASIAGHPIHPMLVVFPIGLWVFSFVADLIYIGGGSPIWSDIAYYAMAGGILGALAAAIPGAIDLFSITAGASRRIGLMHMTINLIIVLLYVLNFGIRTTADPTAVGPAWLAGFSIALLVVSGWLGGALVYEHGVGVDLSQEHSTKPASGGHVPASRR